MIFEDTNTEIANFTYTVVSVKKVMDFSGNNTTTELELKIENSLSSVCKTIPYEELENLDFGKISHAFVVNDLIPNAHKKIVHHIKTQAATLNSKENIVLDKLGWYDNGDKVCYNAGNLVISANPENYIPSPMLAKKYRLEILPDCCECSAIKGAFDTMNIDVRYSPVVFLSGAMGVMRHLILKADIRPASAIYVVGETQNRKTTLTTLCTRLYNRSELISDSTTSMARVNSSFPILEQLLAENKDCAFILDDLFRNPDTKMKRESERNLRSILRNYADNSPRKNMRAQRPVNAQLITAEYLIDSITDLGRCFIVYIKDSVSSEALTPMQKEPLLVSTFYYYFIKYLCSHYYETIERIKREFEEFRKGSDTHNGGG